MTINSFHKTKFEIKSLRLPLCSEWCCTRVPPRTKSGEMGDFIQTYLSRVADFRLYFYGSNAAFERLRFRSMKQKAAAVTLEGRKA